LNAVSVFIQNVTPITGILLRCRHIYFIDDLNLFLEASRRGLRRSPKENAMSRKTGITELDGQKLEAVSGAGRRLRLAGETESFPLAGGTDSFPLADRAHALIDKAAPGLPEEAIRGGPLRLRIGAPPERRFPSSRLPSTVENEK
jgi:hypothetical protein